MNIKLDSNIEDVRRLIAKKGAQAPRIIERGVKEATAELLKECRNELADMVYNKPIPTLPSGRPAWRRTSQLMRQERAYHTRPFEGIIDNRTPYALARHNLNRSSPVDGQTRRAPWRESAMNKSQGRIKTILEKSVRDSIDS